MRSRPLGGFPSSATARRWSPVGRSSTRGCAMAAESDRNTSPSHRPEVRKPTVSRRYSERPATAFAAASHAATRSQLVRPVQRDAPGRSSATRRQRMKSSMAAAREGDRALVKMLRLTGVYSRHVTDRTRGNRCGCAYMINLPGCRRHGAAPVVDVRLDELQAPDDEGGDTRWPQAQPLARLFRAARMADEIEAFESGNHAANRLMART